MSAATLAALAGQPNSGKSTIFNLLTGARQFVANYPGVTVEKKVGYLSQAGVRIELVDLPGAYSLTSYSLEERVTRDFILESRPKVVVNVVDAANLRRSLYLTFQLLEMDAALVLDLNMIDVARAKGMEIDLAELERRLAAPVVVTDGKRGRGREDLAQAIVAARPGGGWRIDYGPLEPALRRVQGFLENRSELAGRCSPRWLAVKLLEGDGQALALAREGCQDWPELERLLAQEEEAFRRQFTLPAYRHIAFARHQAAEEISQAVVKTTRPHAKNLSDQADRLLCHRLAGPLIMCLVFYLLFELAVNQGGRLAAQITPYLGQAQKYLESFLPRAGYLEEALLTSLLSWFMTSVNALLVYIPQFFILFFLIAVLEDVGYMPRMAFMLDRVFRRFGLHGNSTLPYILGGIYVGGCAVPGVMSCRAIPDERARMATILTVPLMNCLAKTAFYIMLVEAFFPQNKTAAMFFISTITLIMALPIARLLSLTVLRGRETAPFIMEMPAYHIPSLRGVMIRAVERITTYIRKVLTIVAAVAVVIWALLQFPGVKDQHMAEYAAQADAQVAGFLEAIAQTPLAAKIKDRDQVVGLLDFRDEYRAAKAQAAGQTQASQAVDERFRQMDADFFAAAAERRSPAYRALDNLRRERADLRHEIKQERINNSVLGWLGQALAPVSRWAGFDWRVNVAMLSSFAARESATATFTTLYGIGPEGKRLDEAMGQPGQGGGISSLNATALMLFMALFPPCLATTIMVRVATGRLKWMLFSFAYPSALGLGAASLVFTGGSALGLDGWQAMWAYYALALILALLVGSIPEGVNNTATSSKEARQLS